MEVAMFETTGEIILVVLLAVMSIILIIRTIKPSKRAKKRFEGYRAGESPVGFADTMMSVVFLSLAAVNLMAVLFGFIEASTMYTVLSVILVVVAGISYLWFGILKHPPVKTRAVVFAKFKNPSWRFDEQTMTFLIAPDKKIEFNITHKDFKKHNVGDIVDIEYQGAQLWHIHPVKKATAKKGEAK
jgi:NADH:ubiquinone oxidoreductase subunit 3 (subunit A)